MSIHYFLFLCFLGIVYSAEEVTHSAIANAIIGLTRKIEKVEDKLERHEMRERQFAEHIKGVTSNLNTKSIKQNNDLSDLKNLLNKFHTSMMQKADLQNEQLKKIIIETAGKTSGCTTSGQPTNYGPGTELLATAKLLSETANKLVANEQEQRRKYEDQLVKLREIVDSLQQKPSDDYGSNTGSCGAVLDSVEATQRLVMSSMSNIDNKLKSLDNNIIHKVTTHTTVENNATLHALSVQRETLRTLMHQTVYSAKDELLNSMQDRLDTSVDKLETSSEKVVTMINSVESLLIKTTDGMLDTKRRVDFASQQVTSEMTGVIQKEIKNLNQNFDGLVHELASDILTNQTQSLANLSARIEAEISQVWRQIGVMYRELSQSAGTLDRLQVQTENYVNGSLSTMDNMSGKVGVITNRIEALGSNLNYLMGRLTSVSQDFNNIKKGLGDALEQAHNDFDELKRKVNTEIRGATAAAKQSRKRPGDDNNLN